MGIKKYLLLVAFGAVSLSGGAECFLTIMASTAEFSLGKSGLGDFVRPLFHFEYFGVAVRAFVLGRVHVVSMAESDRTQIAGWGFKLNISSTHLLLGVSHPESHETNQRNADGYSFPNLSFQPFTPFSFLAFFAATPR
jgi:hypothetical protein